MDGPFRIFIGYDPRQPVSYTVLQHSILTRASRPVAITPLVLETLPIERQGLTPFTFSRFLVPYLCSYKGFGLFLDSDMLLLDDVVKLFEFAREDLCKGRKPAVWIVDTVAKFERASLMLFDCAHTDNTKLTPEYIDSPENKGLHQIAWTNNKELLPSDWNHCIFYDEPKADQKLIHYTAGIPGFPEVQGCPYTQEWMKGAQQAMSTIPWAKLMGNSVHVQRVIEWHAKKAPKPASSASG